MGRGGNGLRPSVAFTQLGTLLALTNHGFLVVRIARPVSRRPARADPRVARGGSISASAVCGIRACRAPYLVHVRPEPV
jgi:hypothetical protein